MVARVFCMVAKCFLTGSSEKLCDVLVSLAPPSMCVYGTMFYHPAGENCNTVILRKIIARTV